MKHPPSVALATTSTYNNPLHVTVRHLVNHHQTCIHIPRAPRNFAVTHIYSLATFFFRILYEAHSRVYTSLSRSVSKLLTVRTYQSSQHPNTLA